MTAVIALSHRVNLRTTYMKTGSPRTWNWKIFCLQSPPFLVQKPRWVRYLEGSGGENERAALHAGIEYT